MNAQHAKPARDKTVKAIHRQPKVGEGLEFNTRLIRPKRNDRITSQQQRIGVEGMNRGSQDNKRRAHTQPYGKIHKHEDATDRSQ